MNLWPLKGWLTPVPATRYPAQEERAPGVTPARPVAAPIAAVDLCPTGALRADDDAHVSVELTRCVHCYRCVRATDAPAEWRDDYEWARFAPDRGPLPAAFRRSIHVRIVDAGDCGACLAELLQVESPDYSPHRLGIYVTPTPRDADVLLVVGPVTNAMRAPLEAAYAAMPEPKRVVAAGACAASGGLFGRSFECDAGAAGVVPVDLVIPGCPPPPLALLHGLLAVMGRKPAEATA
jgi:Ni,Fe-hydrogenase III small subunit/ferredoxin-like protein FixX